MTNDLITCITPTFNRAHLLPRAIESTLNQTYPHWEMIIIDDGSEDSTEEVVRSYIEKDDRIKYFKNPGKGGGSARNYGIQQAKGTFIVFLDDDDISLPHRFESQLKAVKQSGVDFIVSGYQVRNRETDKLITEKKLELRGQGAGFPSRWLISKALLDKVKGFDERFPAMQEIELSYRLAQLVTFALHNQIVTVLFETKNSVSKTTNNSIKGKQMLVDELGNKMHPIEVATWHYTLAHSYFIIGETSKAKQNFKLAADKANLLNFWLAYFYIKIFSNFLKYKILCKPSNFIFTYMRKKKIALVSHPVVETKE